MKVGDCKALLTFEENPIGTVTVIFRLHLPLTNRVSLSTHEKVCYLKSFEILAKLDD